MLTRALRVDIRAIVDCHFLRYASFTPRCLRYAMIFFFFFFFFYFHMPLRFSAMFAVIFAMLLL